MVLRSYPRTPPPFDNTLNTEWHSQSPSRIIVTHKTICLPAKVIPETLARSVCFAMHTTWIMPISCHHFYFSFYVPKAWTSNVCYSKTSKVTLSESLTIQNSIQLPGPGPVSRAQHQGWWPDSGFWQFHFLTGSPGHWTYILHCLPTNKTGTLSATSKCDSFKCHNCSLAVPTMLQALN